MRYAKVREAIEDYQSLVAVKDANADKRWYELALTYAKMNIRSEYFQAEPNAYRGCQCGDIIAIMKNKELKYTCCTEFDNHATGTGIISIKYMEAIAGKPDWWVVDIRGDAVTYLHHCPYCGEKLQEPVNE